MNINNKEKNIQNKKHMLIKEVASILRSKVEEVSCIENSKQSKDLYNKIIKASSRIGTVYFTKSKKSFKCLLLSIGGITIVLDDTPKNESIFIRSSDLDLL